MEGLTIKAKTRQSQTRISVQLEPELHAKLRKLIAEHRYVTISGIVNDLLERHLDRYVDAIESVEQKLNTS